MPFLSCASLGAVGQLPAKRWKTMVMNTRLEEVLYMNLAAATLLFIITVSVISAARRVHSRQSPFTKLRDSMARIVKQLILLTHKN